MALKFFPSTDPFQAFRDRARRIATDLLRPQAVEDDEKGVFRKDTFRKIASEGLHALSLPKALGGGGHPSEAQYAVIEELARASVSQAVSVGVTGLVQGGIHNFGTDVQKKTFLGPLVRGEWLGAFALSEPQSGSDAASLRCAAKKVEGGYRITGTKCWCSNAGFADLYLLMARTGPERTAGITSFLVPADSPGFRVGKQEKKLGLRGSTLAELIFEDCFLPDSHRLGAEGEGLKVALSQLDAGRITIGVAGIALAAEALDRAWRWDADRRQKGLPGIEEGAKHQLALRYAETQAVRHLVSLAARGKDEGTPITILASQVKLLGSELGMNTTSEVITAVGPEATLRENEFERLLRDAKALPIVEGTNQIQKMVLSREMDGMYR